MKRHIIYIACLAAALAGMGACTLEGDTVGGDGKLEGYWHLESITTNPDNASDEPKTDNLKKRKRFWAIQHNLIKLVDRDTIHPELFCRFTVAAGKLTVTEAYFPLMGRDSMITDYTILKPYGIPAAGTEYSYKIKSGKMSLTGGNRQLRLVKF